jgi:hypothetical protein
VLCAAERAMLMESLKKVVGIGRAEVTCLAVARRSGQ